MHTPVRSVLALCGVLTLAACGGGTSGSKPQEGAPVPVEPAVSTPGATEDAIEITRADLVGPDGANHGTVEFNDSEGQVQIVVQASGLEPGFHGMHLHGIGKCEPKSTDPKDATKRGDFLSAGGHLGDGEHPDHAADLPTLLVMKDGTAKLTVVTDRVDPDMLLDVDGTALVIHEKPDNYANIPDRYASGGADDETRKAGDAGARVACAAVTTS